MNENNGDEYDIVVKKRADDDDENGEYRVDDALERVRLLGFSPPTTGGNLCKALPRGR